MGRDVIIDEEELVLFAKICQKKGDLIENMILALSNHISNVLESGIMSGLTAERLTEYSSEINHLKNSMAYYSAEVSRIINEFLAEVEMAESYRG